MSNFYFLGISLSTNTKIIIIIIRTNLKKYPERSHKNETSHMKKLNEKLPSSICRKENE